MTPTTVRIAFGNSENVLVLPPFSVPRLLAYSKNAEAKLTDIENGSSTDSGRSGNNVVETIRFETADGIAPVVGGMEVVLKFLDMAQHPTNGYPASYKGHKSLTVELSTRLAGGRPIPFIGLLRIYEAILLLEPKNHLGRQWQIRRAIMDHIDITILTPAELHKVGVVFSHETTTDVKLVHHAVNKTLDHMEAGRDDGTLSLEEYDAITKVCDAVPALDGKMKAAYKGLKDRLARVEEKAARAAERQAEYKAKRAVRGTQRGYELSATRSKEFQNEKILRDIKKADDGECCIMEPAIGKLMVGPVVIITKKMNVKKSKGRQGNAN